MTPGARRGFIAVGCLIIAITALFILTYPLNIGQSDAVNYARMILANQSNLINASGYPFLFRRLLWLFTSFPPDQGFVEKPDSDVPLFLFKLLIANHAVHLVIVASTVWILNRLFGALVALVTAVLWACSIFYLGSVSISQPEFLQGDLLLLIGAICGLAFMEEDIATKLRLYFFASFLFAWAFLVKYNVLAFGGFFLLILIADRATIRTKFTGLIGCSAIFAFVLSGYILLFHQPNTGSWSLNHDRAWLYVVKLNELFGPDVLQRSPGVAALRWEALAVTVPQEYGGWAYTSLAEGATPAQKQQYRPQVDAVLAMNESELRQYLSDHPHKPGFEFVKTPHPLYWYIGFAEVDRLGSAMFWEYIRNNFGFVMKTTLNSFVPTTLSYFGPVTPTPARKMDLFTKANLGNGFALTGINDPNPLAASYWSYNLVLWEPGTRFFGMIEPVRIGPWTERVLYLCLLAGLFTPFLSRQQKLMAGAFALGLVGFVFAANFIFVFRAKEATAVWPTACLLWAVAIKCVATTLTALWRRTANEPVGA